MAGSQMYVSGVELSRMGQNMHAGPLPDPLAHHRRGQGQYIRELVDPRHLQPLRDRATAPTTCRSRTTSPSTPWGTASSSKTGSRPATSSSTISGSGTKCHPDGSPCVPTNPRPVQGGRRQELRYQRPECRGHPDPVGQQRLHVLDHQPGQYLPRQRGRGSEQIGFWFAFAASIRRARMKARKAATRSGHAERHCGSSRATSPIRTSTASCPTAARGPMATSPSAGTSRWPIPPTRTARRWKR